MKKFDLAVDKSDMLSILLNFCDQIDEAANIAKGVRIKSSSQPIDNIVYCGMGGSAISGDFLKNLLSDELSVPMEIVRNYSLPEYVDERTLIIVASYSGNTEETLSCLEESIKRNTHLIGITSGGNVADTISSLSANSGKTVVRIEIPKGYPPRTAFGFMCVPLLIALKKLGLTKRDPMDDIAESIEFLKKAAKEFNPQNGLDNRACSLASEILNTIPVLYGASNSTDMIARRWTTQFSENAKIIAYYNAFPELNHNEIVGWENLPDKLKDFSVIILHDSGDYNRITARQSITKGILENGNDGTPFPQKIVDIFSEGSSKLTRWLSLIYLGDFVSWYTAIMYGTDPTPVKKIDLLKSSLAELK